MRAVKTKDTGRFFDQTTLSVLEEEVQVHTGVGLGALFDGAIKTVQ